MGYARLVTVKDPVTGRDRLFLNGAEISDGLVGYKIYAQAGEPTMATLELIVVFDPSDDDTYRIAQELLHE